MKNWSGGVLIVGLGLILLLRYSFMGKQPHKQSAYDFFNTHPSKDSTNSAGNSNQMKIEKIQNVEKRPHFVNAEGLDDLYAFRNMSEEESKVLLVWSQMRMLLSRSDALPETFQGIKEAAVSWKELLLLIEKDKASLLNKNIQNDQTCPYSVGVLSGLNTSTSSSGYILEIPCGLVEDSSVTLIGIPSRGQGNFTIELVASQFSEEQNPPIILHFKVFLPGENLTKEPIIVQNTWTNEIGWGKEERCPNHHSANTTKVDGLAKCNEEVVKSAEEEIAHASNLSVNQSSNVSGGSAHVSANFPFSEGSPFTATLWTGVEGFHMSVNGRHETSFEYREKLEPWLVTGVRLTGDVEPVSAIAKGLPVSEDLDLVVDVEHLKAPPIPKKRLVLLIGVFSSCNNFNRRMALRRSWMQYDAVRSGEVAVRFFTGLHKNSQVNFQLWRESQAYGDMQLMPFVDYYSLISLKTIAICTMGTKILPAKYIMKTDDDAFVRIDEVLSSLKQKVSDGLLYGLISFESKPQRDRDNKWFISAEEWPHESYPPWAHGPGYIISRDIAKFIVQAHQKRDLKVR
ncbi:hypothetical protein AgCh_032649 [Apium graveolens]